MGRLVAGLLLVLLLLPLAVGVPAVAIESPFIWGPWFGGYPVIGGPGVRLRTYADRFAEDLRKLEEVLEVFRIGLSGIWGYTLARVRGRLGPLREAIERFLGYLREVLGYLLELVRRVVPWVGW